MRKKFVISILGVMALAMALVPRQTVEASKPVPVIVSNLALTGQVGSFTQTTLLTPSVDGNYRISIYLQSASMSVGKSVIVDWTWDDDGNATQFNSISIEGPATNTHDHAVAILHAAAGSSITVRPGANFNDTTDTYNLYVVLEEL